MPFFVGVKVDCTSCVDIAAQVDGFACLRLWLLTALRALTLLRKLTPSDVDAALFNLMQLSINPSKHIIYLIKKSV
jgi:hypothetical protein